MLAEFDWLRALPNQREIGAININPAWVWLCVKIYVRLIEIVELAHFYQNYSFCFFFLIKYFISVRLWIIFIKTDLFIGPRWAHSRWYEIHENRPLDTVLLSPLINACENYFWEKIIFREKLSPPDKNLIFDSSGKNWPPTVIRSLPSLKSHCVSQVALRYPRIFSSYFILIKGSIFWTNRLSHLFIFTILWLLRLSTSWISENKKKTGYPANCNNEYPWNGW